ncbi:hypothetical protein SUGI_0782510 [Cryptomeria japonica]|uniref:abscisic acid receptor PYL4 n=1 Tax=Cryptomeria japonica TaxID=3369 RepID=UPI002414C219|nr:abscisic acid receptor PYL4 [Cryptomeria japonica]GLJ38425.1 hypothetical protein SUGI_0782510 [Cryptomeria japonica]
MCQPHQLWRFPDFSKIRGQSDSNSGRSEHWSLLGRLAKELDVEEDGEEYMFVREVMDRYHSHTVAENQCCSMVVQRIAAPVADVWSVVRRFDKPQAYKHFIRSCSILRGDGTVQGSMREVRVVSGLPAERSTERLEILDEDLHILSFQVVGGDHRLKNYRSVTTLHDCKVEGRSGGTLVIESYVVDVPEGNSRDDTCMFADTIVRCNLQSLAHISEHLSRRRPGVRPLVD